MNYSLDLKAGINQIRSFMIKKDSFDTLHIYLNYLSIKFLNILKINNLNSRQNIFSNLPLELNSSIFFLKSNKDVIKIRFLKLKYILTLFYSPQSDFMLKLLFS